MKNAYALLGLSFLIVFMGAYLMFERINAPISVDTSQSNKARSDIQSANQQNSMSLTLTSQAFQNNDSIPSKYTCDGANINPELTIAGVPDGTQSLVLLMHDPDIPENVQAQIGQDSFDHWVLYNIDPETETIPEGVGDSVGTPGRASNSSEGYVGSCPPDGVHRYIYTLYAVDDTLAFTETPTRIDVRHAIEGHTIAKVQLIGTYERSN